VYEFHPATFHLPVHRYRFGADALPLAAASFVMARRSRLGPAPPHHHLPFAAAVLVLLLVGADTAGRSLTQAGPFQDEGVEWRPPVFVPEFLEPAPGVGPVTHQTSSWLTRLAGWRLGGPDSPAGKTPASWWVGSDRKDSRLELAPQTSHHAGPLQTAIGRRVRRVLIVALVSGVCMRDDWRGELPRQILKFLPQARGVALEWNPKTGGWMCFECKAVEDATHRVHKTPCEEFLGTGKQQRAAELVIVLGLGAMRRTEGIPGIRPTVITYPEIETVFNSRLVSGRTHSVLVPIQKSTVANMRAMEEFPFHHLVHETDFIKPLSNESITAIHTECASHLKTRDLLYVGRYQQSKGQLKFLQTVDPQDLEGFHVHFYGPDFLEDSCEYCRELERVALARHIPATFHDALRKDLLLRRYCQASGQIHFAEADSNPRVVYEGLYASNPLLVTHESNAHSSIYKEKGFVVPVSFHGSPELFSAAFKRFMVMVRSHHSIAPLVREFADSHLSGEGVYRRLCAQMGLCITSDEWRHHAAEVSAESHVDRPLPERPVFNELR